MFPNETTNGWRDDHEREPNEGGHTTLARNSERATQIGLIVVASLGATHCRCARRSGSASDPTAEQDEPPCAIAATSSSFPSRSGTRWER